MRVKALGEYRSRLDYAYDATTLAPDTETIAYDLNGDGTTDFSRVLDRSQDTLRRDSGWQLKNGSTVENEAAYTYDLAGRPDTVTSPAGTFTYGYVTNGGSLLASVTKSGSPVLQTVNTWETTRDVLDLKQNKVGSTVISSYDYGVNSFGQRTGVDKTGTAFASSRDIAWGYNSKGEVVKADSSISGFDRAYLYDGLGNRKKSANSLTLPSSDNYTTNALNQYTAVNSLSPVYDDDGNATSYPVPAYPSANSTLTWDGENRLISATVNSVTTTYLYDAFSRRIAKVPASGSSTLYLYDGWNCIAEYTGTTLSKTRTWGQDLSGSLQGAGGVGGLLAEKQGSTFYFPTYDGNGNVSEYLTASGTITAHFEYDPFGNTTVDTDTSSLFTYRFSTKPLDPETGLYYYGYRYYHPELGRWISRDPIGEDGGLNLYGFVGNKVPNYIDLLGLKKKSCKGLIRVSHGGIFPENRNNKEYNYGSYKAGEAELYKDEGCGSYGGIRYVGCYSNFLNKQLGHTNGWQNNFRGLPPMDQNKYDKLGPKHPDRVAEDERRKTRKNMDDLHIEPNDLLPEGDERKAVDAQIEQMKKDLCKCCDKITVTIECHGGVKAVDAKNNDICGKVIQYDCNK